WRPVSSVRPMAGTLQGALIVRGDAGGGAKRRVLWQSAYVGVGSNLHGPEAQVRHALAALAQLPKTRLVRQSSLYGSRPWGLREQPDFVNAAAGLLTQLPVSEFFQALQSLQVRLGRSPPIVRWGPRLIDLDLLLFGQLRLQTPELTLPHRGVVSRSFVLYPLHEVAPELRLPGGLSVGELLQRVDAADIWRLDNKPTTHGA
ncbi:MAG TPA: 2-amino-4-hydroxy-6-hydroxymethyldihydropteridine diphosphokinase, partial [Steroidobacteraceae bacterium]|nr:2-amino-4-hydroxy-6-hydroxymethyldihydropteridine diphosphokinase [Steroidobacteraceae bacterium]